MSKFLIVQNFDAQQKIEKDLSYIKKEILSFYGNKNIFSIILCGGFGRGEGSIIKIGEKYEPFNDYDIVLITKNRVPNHLLKNLGEKIANNIGIRFVDIGVIKKTNLKKIGKTIFAYDLKNHSQVIFGDKDILDEIPLFSAKEISKIEGKIILFNRLICFLELTPDIDKLNQGLDQKESKKMILQISKAVIAGVIAFLVLKNKYTTSSQKQLKLFLNLSPNKEWGEIASLGYGLKLGTIKPENVDAWSYWLSVKEFYLNLMRLFLEDYYSSSFNKWEDFFKFYLNIPNRKSLTLRLKELFKSIFWQEPSSNLKVKSLLEIATMSTFLSLNKDFIINKKYFDFANQYIGQISMIVRENNNLIKNWSDAKNTITSLWSTYNH